MTMRSRPNRGDTGRRDQFVDQAAAVETTRLNCNIPTALHLEIKIMAAQQQTDITSAGN